MTESLSYLAGKGREVRGLRSPASFPTLIFSLFQPLPFPGVSGTFPQEVKSPKPRAELDYFEKMTAGWIECFLERCL